MAGWGAMMGLGQGLQQVSGMMLDNHKSKMKEQLEIEKEKRQDTRQAARDALEESKKLVTPQTWQVIRLEDGSLVRQGRNYLGYPIKDALQPMSNVETEEFNRKQALDELNTKHKSLEVTLSSKKVKHYDEDRARDIEYDNARTDSQRASAAAARTRAANSGGSRGSADKPAPTKADVETAVYDRHKSLIDEAKAEYGVSEVAIQAALARAVENEAKRGLPYGSTFQETLTNLIQDGRSKVKTIKAGTK